MIFDTRKSKSYCLGFDLSDSYCQISYLASDSDMPETLSVLAGAELYNIPCILSRKKGTQLWYYGKEAAGRAHTGEDTVITDLVDKARKGEPVQVDDESFDPVALLALFIKRSLSLLSMEMSMDLVKVIMFTARDLDERMIAVLSEVRERLGLTGCDVLYQSHEESLYYYMLYEQEELRKSDVIAADYDFGRMYLYRLRMNNLTHPRVCVVERSEYDELAVATGKLPSSDERIQYLDDTLLDVMKREMESGIVSSVYLLGNGFKAQWMKKSLKFLCTGRRVFQGNNLFSKGASIAGREKLGPGEKSVGYVLLGDDKLRCNVGMKLCKAGQEVYHALMDAGSSWFDDAVELSVIPDETDELKFEILQVVDGIREEIVLHLEGLPAEPARTHRILLKLRMKSPCELIIQAEDLGFGELFPSSGLKWEKKVMLGDSTEAAGS